MGPLLQVHWGFQVNKERFPQGSGESKECDVVVAMPKRLWLVGEVKKWRWPLGNSEQNQTISYKLALGAPRAFLTNGSEWIIWDEMNGRVFNATLDPQDVDTLLGTLISFIGPSAVSEATELPLDIWRAGKSLTRMNTRAGASERACILEWEPAAHEEPYSSLIRDIGVLSNQYPQTIELDVGGSLYVRPRVQGMQMKALIEWAPPEGALVFRERDLETLGIPLNLRERLRSCVRRPLESRQHAHEVIEALEAIVRHLADPT